MAIEERLAAFLKDARDWERRATNIPGVFLLNFVSMYIFRIMLLPLIQMGSF
jgi:hypothetical protein